MAKRPAKPKAKAGKLPITVEVIQRAPGLVSNLKDIQVGPVERPAGSLLKKPPKPKDDRR